MPATSLPTGPFLLPLQMSIRVIDWKRKSAGPVGEPDAAREWRETISMEAVRRDGARCRYCGLGCGSRPEVQPIFSHPAIDGPAGLATACAFCHAVMHLGRSGHKGEGRLAWIPEMTQTKVVRTVRAVMIARRIGLSDADPRLAAAAGGAWLGLARRMTALDLLLGDHEPLSLFEAMAKHADRESMLPEAFMQGIRFVPTGRRVIGEVDRFQDILDEWVHEARTSDDVASAADLDAMSMAMMASPILPVPMDPQTVGHVRPRHSATVCWACGHCAVHDHTHNHCSCVSASEWDLDGMSWVHADYPLAPHVHLERCASCGYVAEGLESRLWTTPRVVRRVLASERYLQLLDDDSVPLAVTLALCRAEIVTSWRAQEVLEAMASPEQWPDGAASFSAGPEAQEATDAEAAPWLLQAAWACEEFVQGSLITNIGYDRPSMRPSSTRWKLGWPRRLPGEDSDQALLRLTRMAQALRKQASERSRLSVALDLLRDADRFRRAGAFDDAAALMRAGHDIVGDDWERRPDVLHLREAVVARNSDSCVRRTSGRWQLARMF